VSSKIQFTAHAISRLNERTNLSQLEIGLAIDYEKATLVSVERGTGLYSYLLYSEREDQFIVVVLDKVAAIVVTIIPIKYWNNLQRDRIRFGNDTEITIIHKFKAIKAANQYHRILQNPPFCGRESIFLSIRFIELDKTKSKFVGTLSVSDVLKKTKNEMEGVLHGLLLNAFTNIGISESPSYLTWRLSKKMKTVIDRLQLIELFDETEIGAIFDAIYTDICKRQENTRRYAKHFE
jgi:hypothetical protein